MSFDFDRAKNIIIWGAGHGIGLGFVEVLQEKYPHLNIYACYRNKEKAFKLLQLKGNVIPLKIDPLVKIEDFPFTNIEFDLCLITIGLLHDSDHQPEKSYKTFGPDTFFKCMETNAYLPLKIAHFMVPLMAKGSVLAALSAKVGSIEDNRLGGWYSYRSSKAALNMLLKTFSLELKNRRKEMRVLSLHPGTVDTQLSKPFSQNISHKVFTTKESANHLLNVIAQVKSDDDHLFFGWDGKKIPY